MSISGNENISIVSIFYLEEVCENRISCKALHEISFGLLGEDECFSVEFSKREIFSVELFV